MTQLKPKGCFCGGSVEIELYEPCDDYPGNGIFSWDALIECSFCKARPPFMQRRYKTKEEAETAAIDVEVAFQLFVVILLRAVVIRLVFAAEEEVFAECKMTLDAVAIAVVFEGRFAEWCAL